MVGTPEQRQEVASRLVAIRGPGTVLDGIAAGTDRLSLETDSLSALEDTQVFYAVTFPIVCPDQVPADFLQLVEASLAELYRPAVTTAGMASALGNEVSISADRRTPKRVRTPGSSRSSARLTPPDSVVAEVLYDPKNGKHRLQAHQRSRRAVSRATDHRSTLGRTVISMPALESQTRSQT